MVSEGELILLKSVLKDITLYLYLTVFCMSFVSGEGGGGGAARRCARDASSPAQAHAPPAPSAAHTAHTTHTVKSERLSPHDSNASR